MTSSGKHQPRPADPVQHVITPRARDIGDFDVRRALPAAQCRQVGPFVFFDQMGPVIFGPGQAMDVRPHPHIGISTLTWLFAGEIRHQDSLGFDLVIRPGEVNWMTAGRGIVHSERSPDTSRHAGAELFGIQAWIALPIEQEEIEPAFYHYSAADIPQLASPGVQLALIAGKAFDLQSPVHTESEIFYAELRLSAGSKFTFPADIAERAIYLCQGSLQVAQSNYEEGSMLVLNPGKDVEICATDACLCMLLGGAALDGERRLWWNFVSSRPERIELAKRDWLEKRFALVPGDAEFIPLPEK